MQQQLRLDLAARPVSVERRSAAYTHSLGSRYDAANLESALIIAGDIERYGGPESGLCRWADLVLARNAARVGTGL